MEISRIIIKEEDGFTQLPTESISSKVFVKDGLIYKINKRNSLEREIGDFKILKDKLKDFHNRLPDTNFFEAVYQNEFYACISQPKIVGMEVKNIDEKKIDHVLKNNREFLQELLNYFFESIKFKKLYPDIVGYPKDPEWFNSVNLIYEIESGNLLLCDVGLSPHEDTLRKFGTDFYDSDNVKIYTEKMKKFQSYLHSL